MKAKLKKDASRNTVLKRQLNRLGKVGGLIDTRFGAHDRRKSEKEKLLQRHIVEKLRRLDDVDFEVDETDPLTQAAFGNVSLKTGRHFKLDEDADAGISGDVVEEEFFTSGFRSKGFKDSLAEKIAISKMEKLKRVEENEELRNRTKKADVEWTQKIRFMFQELNAIKSKKATNSAKSIKNRNSVSALLGTIQDDKKIVPSDFKQASSSDEKQLDKLQSVIEKSIESRETSQSVVDLPERDVHYRPDKLQFLRILLRMQEYEQATCAFMAHQLDSAQFQHLTDVARCLFLVQLLLDHYSVKITRARESMATISPQITGFLITEIPAVLTRIWRLVSSPQGITPFTLSTLDGKHKRNSFCEPESLSISLLDPSVEIPAKQTASVSLSCVNRLITLSIRCFQLFNSFLPSCVCVQMFGQLNEAMRSSDSSTLPPAMLDRLQEFSTLFDQAFRAPTPARLSSEMRLAILKAEQTLDTRRAMKKIGLIPQLEPNFDERLDARHPKKVSTRRLLQRKLAREKRGAMRELRRDSQFLTTHQLQKTKASDEFRKQKTQAILNSLRSVDD